MNRRLGRFEILRKIARGGMADVYLGRDERTGRTVALKLIEHAEDPDTIDSIAAERRGSALQARLAAVDPRVVQIYDVDDMDEYFYVAMEYIEGEDLAEVIRRGPLPAGRAVEIALDICETLDHAHNLEAEIDGKHYNGIVHGDVKPRNIRIDTEGRTRLLDFGIAKALSLSRRVTRNEFGSIQYASPERLDTGDVDRSSDLWSVGVVLYEMVTGMPPYQAGTTERLERMIRSRVPPPPAPDPCPEPLRRILMRALDPDAAARYGSAAEFTSVLADFRHGEASEGPAPAAAGEATRRTVRPVDDSTRRTARADFQPRDDETRRTARQAEDVVATAPPVRRKRGIGRTFWRTVLALFLAAVFFTVYEVTSRYLLWKHGQQLETAINAETLTDPDEIWQRWTKVAGSDGSSLLLYGARHAVERKLVAPADAVIATYRNNETQPVHQKDWERARSYLAKALTLDPGSDSIRGKLRLCEAHLARIAGTSRRNAAALNDAAEKFNEAQQLMPKSPDPQLGLARLYVYGFKDIDKADEALHDAERHGYRLGNREKGQLADGYRDRADRLWYDSRNVRGLPQEKEEVQKALDDYNRALALYREITPYGDAASNIARVQNVMAGAQYRLQQIEAGSGSQPDAQGAAKRWP